MKTLNQHATEVAAWRKDHGFITPATLKTEHERDQMLGKLMLVVTEVAEAAEAVRHNDIFNFQEEIADTFIRLLDIAGSIGFDLDREVGAKMEKNQQRPVRHGKHCSL